MSLSERLQAALTTAMRNRDELRRDTLRMVVAAATNAEKTARRPLTDDEFLGVLTREVKTRRESVEAFRGAGREDLASKEESEVAILTEFLPEQLSEDEIRDLVHAAIRETGAATVRDLGKVMGRVSPRTKGRADGKVVSGIVAQELARADLAGHEQAHE